MMVWWGADQRGQNQRRQEAGIRKLCVHARCIKTFGSGGIFDLGSPEFPELNRISCAFFFFLILLPFCRAVFASF